MPSGPRRSAIAWSLTGSAGFVLLPWYAVADGILMGGWPAGLASNRDAASALLQALRFGRPWLLASGVLLAVAVAAASVIRDSRRLGAWLVGLGAAGFLYTLGQGFAIGLDGWSWPVLGRLFGS